MGFWHGERGQRGERRKRKIEVDETDHLEPTEKLGKFVPARGEIITHMERWKADSRQSEERMQNDNYLQLTREQGNQIGDDLAFGNNSYVASRAAFLKEADLVAFVAGTVEVDQGKVDAKIKQIGANVTPRRDHLEVGVDGFPKTMADVEKDCLRPMKKKKGHDSHPCGRDDKAVGDVPQKAQNLHQLSHHTISDGAEKSVCFHHPPGVAQRGRTDNNIEGALLHQRDVQVSVEKEDRYGYQHRHWQHNCAVETGNNSCPEYLDAVDRNVAGHQVWRDAWERMKEDDVKRAKTRRQRSGCPSPELPEEPPRCSPNASSTSSDTVVVEHVEVVDGPVVSVTASSKNSDSNGSSVASDAVYRSTECSSSSDTTAIDDAPSKTAGRPRRKPKHRRTFSSDSGDNNDELDWSVLTPKKKQRRAPPSRRARAE
jgi:hypothetical protein